MTGNRDIVQGKRVTVLGAGASGIAVAKLLKRKGAAVFLSEQKPLDGMKDASAALQQAGVDAEFGGHSLRALEADWMVVSPGIPLTVPLLQQAIAKRVPVFGELEVASWFCAAPVVAVTGSNGKSTTTVLIGDMFRASGKQTAVAGNIGRPFSEDAEMLSVDGVAVLEVSSFQLETISTFHPKIALILNLTPDHLNRHGSLENYARFKARICENQTESDFLVLNGQDQHVLNLAQSAKSRKSYFGVDVPGQRCGFVQNGRLVLRMNGVTEDLVAANDMGIHGEHNVANALAASLACRLMDVPQGALVQALRAFKGLPHRLEFVRRLDGIDYVNDSKATNVDSVWYALGSFSQPIVLIAGGRDKDSDFTVLRERIREKVRAIVLIGEATEKIADAWNGLKPLVQADSLLKALERARDLARSGDVVLLSPACASFDMFRNFEDRGDQFRRLVKTMT
jgi:UDP-N-acetylmuramoylalanine--D-glutamate ligase